jgi:hypothetical protein
MNNKCIVCEKTVIICKENKMLIISELLFVAEEENV